MKKILILFYSLTISMPLLINVVSCNLANPDKNDAQFSKDLNEIVNPVRGWPPCTSRFLSAWNYNLSLTSKYISEYLVDILLAYSNDYNKLFDKYYKNPCPDNVEKDKQGVPLSDIKDFMVKDIYNGNAIQYYAAYSLREYYIEMNINKIKNPKQNFYWINPNEIVNLYAMYFWRGLALFDWEKMYLKQIDTNLEVGIDINFYDFSGAAPADANNTDAKDWTKVKESYKDTLPKDRNKPQDRIDKKTLDQDVYINPELYSFTDKLFRMLYPQLNQEKN